MNPDQFPATNGLDDLARLLDAAQSPQGAAWIGAACVVMLGGALWFAGARFARPMLVTLGAVAGVIFGIAAVDKFGASAPGTTIAGAAAGAGAGLIASLLAFRILMAAIGGASLGFAGAAATWIASVAIQGPAPAPSAPNAPVIQTVTFMQDAAAPLSERVTDASASLVETGQRAWEKLHPPGRLAVAGVGLLAALVGFLAGLIRPEIAAAILTSTLGAGLAYSGASHLVGMSGVLESPPHVSAVVAVGAWAVAALIGAVWQIRSAPAKKSAANAKPAAK